MKVRELPKDDRPIEKLMSKGSVSLSDAELIAIIISSGGSDVSVVELAQNMVSSAGGLFSLLNSPAQKLLDTKYLGKVKTARLLAVKETINRYVNPQKCGSKISGPKEAYEYLRSSFYGKETEHLYLVSLNSRNSVIEKNLISVGTVNETLIHPREIIKTAMSSNAVSIILAHNHPSGEPYPSPEDIKVTQRLEEACQTVGIGLIDHLIVCDDSFSSMRAQNFLKGGE